MKPEISQRRLLSLVLVAGIALQPLSATASSVALANAPMITTSTNEDVLPNLMLVIDDSGSMKSDYLPDWASSGTSEQKRTNAYNSMYYDPAITYSAPAFFNADGTANTTTYPSLTGNSDSTGGDSSATAVNPNWAQVEKNPYQPDGTVNLSTATRLAYVVEPGEYCVDATLSKCQSTASNTYTYPAPLRWCDTSENAVAASPAVGKCQAVKKSGYDYARMPNSRTSSFSIYSVGYGATVTSIKVNGQEILSGAVSSTSTNTSAMAQKIVNGINNCNGIATGQCTVAGFAATYAGSKVTITAGKGTLATPVVATTGTFNYSSSPSAFSSNKYPGYLLLRVINPGSSAVYPYPGIYPGTSSVAKAPTRTDCAGTYCTGNEEMTNYANWYSYYRTRTQSIKTSVSLAFQNIDARYRIGIMAQSNVGTTDGVSNNFLHIDKFEKTHKNLFYKTLFAMNSNSWTPTRSALAKVGKIFAGKLGPDPMQYSCQKNYAFVATDGYWNSNEDYGSPWGLTGNVGDVDSDPTARPYLDTQKASNTLADIARYYSVTDLRTKALANCKGGTLPDGTEPTSDETNDEQGVCPNEFGSQSMTTFTMGLGVSGTLQYTSDYRTATTGDYADLKIGNGTANWPAPKENEPSAIDDLWHAAVNSDGIYFSAKSPTEVVKSLRDALGQIDKVIGSGAAAAASSLQPTSGDNFNYVASYTTVEWTGNLEARTINLNTGATAMDATWCVENVVADSCAPPGVSTAITVGSSNMWVCRTTSGGVNTDVEMANTCTGTLQSKVAAASDTRTIYMSSGSALQEFSYDNIVARGLNAHFEGAWLKANLSQNATLSTDQLAALSGSKLVGYLRGRSGYEMRSSNAVIDKLFRARTAVLGDIVESQPAYVSTPTFSYTDTGYEAFKAAKASRPGTVYVGANDGMLHAFDGSTGNERWAFVPTPVIPNMWRLADEMYSINHHNYVNGSPVISDICTAGCDGTSPVWKTILVGGLNGGGRGYYALDITDPTAPSLLWEFTSANDSDLGFTYGNPVVAKRGDGKWVVLVTSGYNNGTGSGVYVDSTEISNSPAGSGKGILYVLEAGTGGKLAKISTGVGSATTPSGLAKISAWADDSVKNNTATYAYGGDLLGNLWRFDINTKSFLNFANLKDADGAAQPVTTRPELGKVGGKRMVFVGTGKYLEKSDTDSSTFKQQSAYGIMDADATTTLSDPRAQLAQQTWTNDSTARSSTNNSVDYSKKRGWYVDFPDVGERENVDPILESGTLLIPTLVPTSTVCSPGGYSWLNYVNYKTGGPVSGSTSTGKKYNSPIVGLNIIYINKNTDGTGGKKPVLSVVLANKPTPSLVPEVPFVSSGAGFSQKKVIWRELIQ